MICIASELYEQATTSCITMSCITMNYITIKDYK